jgi:hypothetical protein
MTPSSSKLSYLSFDSVPFRSWEIPFRISRIYVAASSEIETKEFEAIFKALTKESN